MAGRIGVLAIALAACAVAPPGGEPSDTPLPAVAATSTRASSGPPVPTSSIAASPAAAASASAPAGAKVDAECAPIPNDAFYVLLFYGSSTRAASRWSFSNRGYLDFDGDGTNDVMVPQPRSVAAPSTCPFDVEWDLYLRQGECGARFVGRVRGRPKTVSSVGSQRVLETLRDNAGPSEVPITFRYAFDGKTFRKIDEVKATARPRCAVHPADCVSIHCRLAGHPQGGFDHEALDVALRKAQQDSQACAEHLSAKTRCDLSLSFDPASGKTKVDRITHCAEATSCVRAAYAAIVVPRYTAHAGLPQTSRSSVALAP